MTDTSDAPMAYGRSTSNSTTSIGTITTPPPRPVSAPRKPARNAPSPRTSVNCHTHGTRSWSTPSPSLPRRLFGLAVLARRGDAPVLRHRLRRGRVDAQQGVLQPVEARRRRHQGDREVLCRATLVYLDRPQRQQVLAGAVP